MSGGTVSAIDLAELLVVVARGVDVHAGVPAVFGVQAYATYSLAEGHYIRVLVHAKNAADVDAIADWWGLPPEDGTGSNYTRGGMTASGQVRHELTVFSGRPATPAVTS